MLRNRYEEYKSSQQHKIIWAHVAFMALMSALYTIPFIAKSDPTYMWRHDLRFHMSRIIGLSNIWESPISFEVFSSHGNAVNYFYPWQTAYPLYLFYKITGNLTLATNLYLLLVTFVTMLIAYFAMQKFKHNPQISLIFSLLYSFSLYRTDDFFVRMALGEGLSLTFLPLVLLGCFEIFAGNYKKWYYLSIGIALIAYSHVLSLAMVSVFIGVVLLLTVWFWKERSQRLLAFLYATVVAALISSAYLLPMLEQYKAQEIYSPHTDFLFGAKPAEVFDAILNNSAADHSIGLTTGLAGIIALICWKHISKVERILLALGLVVLIGTLDYIPWNILSKTPLLLMQFVFRLNMFSTLLLTFVGSIAIAHQIRKWAENTGHPWKTNLVAISFLGAIVAMLNLTAINNVVANEALKTNENNVSYREVPANELAEYSKKRITSDYANTENSDQYPRDAVYQNQFLLGGETISPDYSYTPSEYTIQVQNDTGKPQQLVTPVFYYLGSFATVNDVEVVVSQSDYGTMQVEIPEGSSTVTLRYEYTSMKSIGRGLTAVGVVILVTYIVVYQVKHRRQ